MKIRSILAYGLLALITTLYFIPKTNLYYQLEHTLQPYGIIVHDEHVDDRWLWLEVTNAQLYIQKIESLYIQKTRVMLFGGYNQIDFEDIILASTLGQFVPKGIKSAVFYHAIYNPLSIQGSIIGDFGQAEVRLNLYEGILTAKIEASELMKAHFSTTLQNFTRDKKGAYHYEYRF